VNLVIEIAWDEPAGIENGDRCLWHSSQSSQLPDKRKDHVRLRPQNQGLELVGSATNFNEYVENTYRPLLMPLMAKTTQDRSRGVIANYLVPEFGKLSLRDLTPLTLQRYFSGLAASPLAHESKDKIKDVLSAILGSTVQYGLLVKNPVEGIRLPAERRGKRKTKPHVTPEQFEQLLELIPEPYASMVFVAVWTGLRVMN